MVNTTTPAGEVQTSETLASDARRMGEVFDKLAIVMIVVGALGVLGFVGAANEVSSNDEPAWPYLVLALTTGLHTALVWAGLKLGGLIARHIGQRD